MDDTRFPADDEHSLPTLDPDGTAVSGEPLPIAEDETLAAPQLSVVDFGGAEIPGFRFIRMLGEGGMGVVFEAEQFQPKRHVAIKLLKGTTLLSKNARSRFDREIETLARLNHPHIAAIHASGNTTQGQPYLAMELVRGSTLRDHVQQRSELTREELTYRLTLMRALCLAIHYAHQRGVIHRDLKPGNVVIDDQRLESGGLPRLKILDFGLARLTDEEQTTATDIGAVKGTLAYMSPEQAKGKSSDIDTRTDVYALGVILFEMLSGKRPHELSGMTLVQAVRRITEDEQSTLRSVWPDDAVRLPTDLATIVGKAVAPDPDRRYASASELADDIQRFLEDQPVLAQPPSSTYLLKKFAKRNKALVAGGAFAVLALIGAVITSTIFALSEAEQRRETEQALEDVQNVASFQAGIISEIDPAYAGQQLIGAIRQQISDMNSSAGDEDLIRENLGRIDALIRELNSADVARSLLNETVLTPASEAAALRFDDRPDIEIQLLQTISDTQSNLGLRDEAAETLARAIDLSAQTRGSEAPETLMIKLFGAELEGMRGDAQSALAQIEELEPRFTEAFAPGSLELSELAQVRGQMHVALGEFDEVLSVCGLIADQMVARDPGFVCSSAVAVVYLKRGELDQASATYERILESTADSPDAVLRSQTMMNLAAVRLQQNQLEDAERLLIDALEVQQARFGEDHPRTLSTLNNLGIVYSKLNRNDDALNMDRRVLAARKRMLGDTHPQTVRTMNNLAVSLMDLERYDEARNLLEEVIAIDERVDRGSTNHGIHLHTYAELHMALEEWPQARDRVNEAIAIYRRVGHRYLESALEQLAEIESHL